MHSKEALSIQISSWTVLKIVAILGGLFLLYFLSDIVAALLFAVIVASAMEPVIEWLRVRKIPRLLSVVLVYLVVILALFLLVYFVFPPIVQDLGGLVQAYPLLEQQVLSGIKNLPFTDLFSDNIQEILHAPSLFVDKIGGGIFGFASAAFGGILSFILIIVFSFYLAAQERGIESFLRLVTPIEYEPYVLGLWSRSQRKLGRWLRTQLLLGAVVGVLVFVFLTLLGVRHAFLFSILSAVFEIVPVVGPILAAVPGIIFGFLDSPLTGLLTVILYTLVQQLESHVIVPVVMRKTVGLSPLVIIIALLVGGKIGGIFGILLAVPVTSIVAEFINDWDKKKRALLPE